MNREADGRALEQQAFRARSQLLFTLDTLGERRRRAAFAAERVTRIATPLAAGFACIGIVLGLGVLAGRLRAGSRRRPPLRALRAALLSGEIVMAVAVAAGSSAARRTVVRWLAGKGDAPRLPEKASRGPDRR